MFIDDLPDDKHEAIRGLQYKISDLILDGDYHVDEVLNALNCIVTDVLCANIRPENTDRFLDEFVEAIKQSLEFYRKSQKINREEEK